jgi:hypothetical protein
MLSQKDVSAGVGSEEAMTRKLCQTDVSMGVAEARRRKH